MFVYIDETGNTGANFLDRNQPEFLTAALMTRDDIDASLKVEMAQIAKSVGVEELHGTELGVAGMERISRDLRALLRSFPHAFYFARVKKVDLVALKFFDTVFDPSDNPAASALAYYASPLRAYLAYALYTCLNVDALKEFWSAINANSTEVAHEKLKRASEMALSMTGQIEDDKVRQRLEDALRWASANPDGLTFYLDDRRLRPQHFANAATFPSLLAAVQDQADLWNQKVTEIRHDEQDQFGPALRSIHEMMASASPGTRLQVGTEELRLDAVPGSQFVMPSSSNSPGIQIADVMLWVLKRHLEGKPLGKLTRKLLSRIFDATAYELSFAAFLRRGNKELGNMLAQPVSEQMLREGRKLLEVETSRIENALNCLDNRTVNA